MLKLLILVHVLSAVIGIGPTYFGLAIMRPGLRGNALRGALELGEKLTFFPKIGGTIAVLSGLALAFLGGYGPITQVWLLGSIILYALVQVVVIGFAAPREARLLALARGEASEGAMGGPIAVGAGGAVGAVAVTSDVLLRQVVALHWLAAGLGTLLFVLMILKPT